MKAQISVPMQRGFALIATISVLLLLTLIAVAFLSLSAVTVTSSRIEWAEEEARANARLALMIAIGELQREMGPDQRVSATASIFDKTVDTEDISRADVKQPHWVGVWSTNWGEATSGTTGGSKSPDDLTPWERDSENGGLRDRRYSENWDRKSDVSTWLVSGNEGGRARSQSANRDFKDAADDGVSKIDTEDQLEIVSDGSVFNPDDKVTVPAVSIQREVRLPNGQIRPTSVGRYAYWISDESTKASMSVPDKHSDESPSVTGEKGYQRVFNAQDIESSVITGLDEIPLQDQERLISTDSIELLQGVDSEDLKRLYHDITANTRSVLVNNRDGGLKKDLSIPIVENRSVGNLKNGRLEYAGLDLGQRPNSDDGDQEDTGDLLVGPPNPQIAGLMGLQFDPKLKEISPRFRVLANWLEMARRENFSLNSSSLDLSGQQSDLKPLIFDYGSPKTGRSNVWDRLLGDPGGAGEVGNNDNIFGVKYTQIDSASMKPVVVEAGFYYNVATRERSGGKWQLFTVMYPRVALWNPYSTEMVLPPMLIQLFINGNKDLTMKLAGGGANGGTTQAIVELGFGSRRGGGNGNLWFLLAESVRNGSAAVGVTIPPGQTLVFTPDLQRSKRQGNLRGNYSERGDTLNNLLTPFNPEKSSNYLLDEMFYSEAEENAPSRPIEFVESGASRRAGGDNFQFMLKDATGVSRALLPEIQRMPMMVCGNISLQAGGGDELPVVWDSSSPVPVFTFQNNVAGRPLVGGGGNTDPDVRTRDGFRMRWFREHPSNTDSTARFSNGDMEKLFQTSHIGNWNVRASYIIRNPWDNVTDEAPYFFGNYTRDEFDDAISWGQTNSVKVGSYYTGFPFGSPQSSYNAGPVILFELPSENTGIPNLAHLRHVQLSELAWHPTYAIGNSLADPRCQMNGTVADLSQIPDDNNGWNRRTIGYTSGGGGPNSEYWARLHRELLMYKTDDNHVVFDMSYETNFNLWDTYMIVNGTPTVNTRNNQLKRFAQDPKDSPLPNGRLGLFRRPDLETEVEDDLTDFFRAASRLSLEGGFNVNSTSVEAWKALLASTIKVSVKDSKEAVFPRFLNPVGGTTGNSGITEDALTGNRELSENEVTALAEAIVAEVKLRAPFFGMADFVNRRLVVEREPKLSRAGAIESALVESGVNSSFETGDLGVTSRNDEIQGGSHNTITDPTRLDHRLKPSSRAWGIPGFLTQGDVLGVIGSALTARGDTFKIRAYGESRDVNGKVLARAWCEATVQRTPEPVEPDEFNLNPKPVTGKGIDFGRRFRTVGFRWLDPAEV